MDVFAECQNINELMECGNEDQARNDLIRVLHHHKEEELEYSPLINHLIRRSGLYPYLDLATASWQDRLVSEAFQVDVGGPEKVTLHREQSFLLHKLLDGVSVAVTAPTSFGKSFVIDSFISIKKPKNIAIIVPTIALTDETRRRLQKKFGTGYKIITTSDQELADRNIFIFPQERAVQYAAKLESLDILIIDEFYKASMAFDKERSPALLRAMLQLGRLTKQRYFLAPNISDIKDSVFTKGMEVCKLDFNTVFLEKIELQDKIQGNQELKSKFLLNILKENSGRTLIYAGTYTNVKNVSMLLIADGDSHSTPLLEGFSRWLAKNYDPNWSLTKLVKKGTGIHTGQLHRSLSQIQVKLFEDDDGLRNIISTSSIIEGVNTSAQNVVLWSNLSGKGKATITDFSYRNIIGRGGRMLRHFIGQIFILENPPDSQSTKLELDIPDELLGAIVEDETAKAELTHEQLAKIIAFKEEMAQVLDQDKFKLLTDNGTLATTDTRAIKSIVLELHREPTPWRGLGLLNSDEPEDWTLILYRVLQLQPAGWSAKFSTLVEFTKVLSGNWIYTIPQLLAQLEHLEIGLDDFFKLERLVTFKLPTLLGDISTIQRKILEQDAADISTFIAKVSSAFLPKVVHQLEEYGLPRCLARKLHDSGVIDFENLDLDIYEAIRILKENRMVIMDSPLYEYDTFDQYVFDYFFEGVGYDGA